MFENASFQRSRGGYTRSSGTQSTHRAGTRQVRIPLSHGQHTRPPFRKPARRERSMPENHPDGSPVAMPPRRGNTDAIASRSSVKSRQSLAVPHLTDDSGKLRVIPIAGCEEIGRNMYLVEYGRDIVIVDMGLQFPEEDMPGIDYIIPNISYLKGKEKNIRGVIITHGHYDHIGAIPHLIPELGNPVIYGTALTIGIIKKRQDDFRTAPLRCQVVRTHERIKLGIFDVEFFLVSHNIPDAIAVVIHTPVGTLVHTGDFKIDPNPSGQAPTEIERIKEIGQRGVKILMGDSTNATESGHQLTEDQIQGNIDKIIAEAPGRIIIGTFSSLLGRIQQIIWAAEKHNKRIIVEGFSMKSNVEIAKQLGYIKVKRDTIITEKQMRDYPNNRIIVLCTGAQGEGRAVMMRIAMNEHRYLKIEPGDTVVFSSSVIPGNERSVERLKDGLARQNATVVHYQMMDVHAGGHGKAEDLKWMIQQLKPEYIIPIHGNHYKLKMHGKLAIECGIDPKKIIVPDNGSVIEFTSRTARMLRHKVPSDYVFVDGLGVGDVSDVVLRDRQIMAADGMLVLIATIYGRTGALVQNPDIISRGFIYLKENKRLVEEIRHRVRLVLDDRDSRTPANDTYIKEKIRNDISQFIFQKTERRPMILPVIIIV